MSILLNVVDVGVFFALTLTMLPAMPMACPVSDGHLSFHRRKERWERNAARNRWFLDFLARITSCKAHLPAARFVGTIVFGANVVLSLLLLLLPPCSEM